jgi:hypothetical protein
VRCWRVRSIERSEPAANEVRVNVRAASLNFNDIDRWRGNLVSVPTPTFLAQRPQDAFGRHRYDPADFCWTDAGLATEFRNYTDRYGVKTGETAPAG